MEDLRESVFLSQTVTWEEESGFLKFLSAIPREVKRFNGTFGFNLKYNAIPPETIDGNKDITRSVAFVLARYNPLIPNRQYCLYSLLRNKALYGYIGIYEDGSIVTVREIGPIGNFRKMGFQFYDWMRHLVKVSCGKY
jgi:hypothetical protein